MSTTSLTIYFLIVLCVHLNPLALARDESQFIYNGFHGANNLHLDGFAKIFPNGLLQLTNQFIYNGFHGANNLHLDGSAKIFPNGLLQLTNNSGQQTGRTFYKFPIRFKPDTLSFSTHFVFAIVPKRKDIGLNGIAFAISPSMDFRQAVGSQYFGLLNVSNNGLASNHLLAIELDTLMNAEFNDTDGNHVGIDDVNSLRSNVSASAMYYSSNEGINKRLDLKSGNPIQVWIDYDEVENQLNVTLAPMKSMKPEKPLLSTQINLSTILSDYVYVGFSGATGSIEGGAHYVLGWSFNKSGKAQNLQLSELPSLPHQRKPREKPGIEITVTLIAVSTILIVLIMGFLFLYFVRMKKYEEVHEDWEEEYGPHRFRYKDLYKATKGFVDEELLGAGVLGRSVFEVSEISDQLKFLDIPMQYPDEAPTFDGRPDPKAFIDWVHKMNRFFDWHKLSDDRKVRFAKLKAPILWLSCVTTTSTDVFAFGAFMLEVACGRRPIEPQRLPEEIVLVDWVLENWNKGTVLGTVDPKLGGDYLKDEMELVLKLGLLCSHSKTAMSPSMRQVVQYLGGDALFPEILHEATSIGVLYMGNETSAEFGLSFPSSIEKSSIGSMASTESILNSGH
ncbi:concanavalin A-like lectin protein kinase family protein [Actinidia rufa]|uniref:Concanavalin A-like lectin protein kinase family protein n=1 Tax=Actinidia rufa TaxID=165716 RepID=A0A7J0GR19_9ERIC|nr:concanavalin A-like lectin protein kinase family protein [Actinidia rufa]